MSLVAIAGCASDSFDDPEQGGYEGTEYDAENPGAPLDDGKSDAPHYVIPSDLPTLVAPEIIVSLDGLTVHLFDRETGMQWVYPAGVGVKEGGVSITPPGHYKTGADSNDAWWYAPRRTVPAYFMGLPFLRTTARNTEGANTYALHGPVTTQLIRGYVSHGCIRMRPDDIVRLFWMVKAHPNTPVTFQREVELDAAGQKVDVGTTPKLWPVRTPIEFGRSVGPRPW